MKLLYPLLVIAAVCCFAPAMSHPVRNDDEDEKVPTLRSSCLQKAMDNNEKASEDVIRFICAYMKLKVLQHKEDFIKAIKQLEDATGCTAKDIFGTTESLEHLALDENGVVTGQIMAMKHLLKQRGVHSVGEICIILDSVLPTDDTHTSVVEAEPEHKRFTRNLLGGDLLGTLLGVVPSLLGNGQGSGPLSLISTLLGGGGGGHRQAHGCGGGGLTDSLLGGVLGGGSGGQRQAGGGLLDGLLSGLSLRL